MNIQADIGEKELIASAAAGDNDAFGRIVSLYEKLVYNTVKIRVKQNEDALDVSQEVFIKIWKALPNYRGDCRFSTWIYRIAVNASLDFLRKYSGEAPENIFSGGDDEPEREIADEGNVSSPEEALDRSETVNSVRHAIKMLPEDMQQVILLRDIEGYSYAEIADMLEIEMGTLKSRLNRARESLKEKLILLNVEF